ncbi:MAG TPA: hypothetical protein VLF67_05185 [Candidatus Saccharimonas sp.]|nr:hypothetical protein [Candidatus Saccharimonas sp.]
MTRQDWKVVAVILTIIGVFTGATVMIVNYVTEASGWREPSLLLAGAFIGAALPMYHQFHTQSRRDCDCS